MPSKRAHSQPASAKSPAPEATEAAEQDTESPPEPANRAERRAQKKGKTLSHGQVPGKIQPHGVRNAAPTGKQFSNRRSGG